MLQGLSPGHKDAKAHSIFAPPCVGAGRVLARDPKDWRPSAKTDRQSRIVVASSTNPCR